MKHRRLSPALIIIALGSLVGSLALSQEEFAGGQLTSCAIDIPAHCGSAQPGGGRIVKCLHEKRAEITPECRAAVTPTDFVDDAVGLTVEVAIDHFMSRQGTVIVMLHEDTGKFPLAAKRTVILPITGDTVTTAFRHLKAGTYAVTALHDLDDNSKFEKGEGFAVSNGVSGVPNFRASALRVDANASVAISMRYP
jgi:uncharacterized protein (DUF2141 family)